MTLKEAYEKQRLERLDLSRQVQSLQKQLRLASASLFTPVEEEALIKEKNALVRQLKAAEKEKDRYNHLWRQELNLKEYECSKRFEAEAEAEALRRDVARKEAEIQTLQKRITTQEKKLEKMSVRAYTPEEKAELIKQICDIKKQFRAAEKDRDHYKQMWNAARERALSYDFSRIDLENEKCRLEDENRSLREELRREKEKSIVLQMEIEAQRAGREIEDLHRALIDSEERSKAQIEAMDKALAGSEAKVKELNQTIAESEAKANALVKEVARLQAIIDADGTNSGIPTSRTPIGKNKVIPNSRPETDRNPGGQPGHAKNTLKTFPEEEATKKTDHTLETCPDCGATLEKCGQRIKEEIDYEVKVVKHFHRFVEYLCPHCGKVHHAPIPRNLKEPVQYGENIQATALALLNLGFVSVGRTGRIFKGLLNGVSPSDGYIIKLQKRYSKELQGFAEEVHQYLLKAGLIYWDDTVIFINTTRGCMRFYGDEQVALYKAHAKKNREGLDEDNILSLLGSNVIVMHDHNAVNYNDDFDFQNVECNEHLERDLQRIVNLTGHEWAAKLKKMIQAKIHERKLVILQNGMSFSEDTINEFFIELDKLLLEASGICDPDCDEERRMIKRLGRFRDNYFRWLGDFRIPVTNNLSERALRMIKCHEKVSGQFRSIEYARYFANIQTYLGTCRRHGVNEFEALQRLTQGNPFTLSELLARDAK